MEISQGVASNIPVTEDIDMPEVESEDQTGVETSNQQKRKKPATEFKCRSEYWKNYEPLIITEGDPPVEILKGECKTCKTLIKATRNKNDTSALKKHTLVCRRRQAHNKNQGVLNLQATPSSDGTGTLTTWKFDQKEIRMLVSEMVILQELPFRFVEHKAFKRLFARACPQFVVPGRKAIKSDCVRLFKEGKNVLKSSFAKEGMGRVSITTDCWTSNDTSFICVTLHFIRGDWKLQKKIIRFQKISGHKGEDIAHSVLESLDEWELKTLICCTMDNASANDKVVDYLRGFLNNRKRTILDGKYLHLRCVAHIINLVVSDGLQEIGQSVRRVREVVKWIKGSSARIDQFNICVKMCSIESKKFLCLDVPTRWNSTYLMLEAAEPFADAIKMYLSVNGSTFAAEGPGEEDWINVRKMIRYLKRFYDMTCCVSGHTYAASHLFLLEMCDLDNIITELEQSTDVEIALMASKMRAKVAKYWLEDDALNPKMNPILYIAAVLDPRQKIKVVERCFKKLYGDVRANELVTHVKNLVFEMFDHYKTMLSTIPSLSSTTSLERRSHHRDSYSGLLDCSDDDDDTADSSELTIYLAEKYKKESAFEFDILVWWSKHDLRYPILSEMAKDLLAIPISTVPSESAFSTGDRVLDKFRSSLSPSTVEALICVEDWLLSSYNLKMKEDEEDEPEEEQEKEFEEMWSSKND